MKTVFTETAKGKITTSILLAILTSLALILVGTFIAGFVLFFPIGLWMIATGQFKDSTVLLSGDFGTLISLFATLGTFLTTYLWIRFKEKRPFVSLGFFKKDAGKELALGWLIGAALFTVIIVILGLLGMVQISGFNFSLGFLGLLLLYILAWQLQSASEELLTRGYLLPVVASHHQKWLAVAISSLFFGILHLTNPNVTFLSITNITLFGLFMCLYVLWKGNLWGACGIHAAWNCFQGSIFGVEVSGITGYSSLLTLKISGAEVLTGGSFGVEGSFLTTILLMICCAYIYLRKIKN